MINFCLRCSKKQVIDYRSGPWNGLRFSGVPEMNTSDVLTFSFVTNPNEVTYSFAVTDNSIYSRLIVNPSGILQRLTWIETSQVSHEFPTFPFTYIKIWVSP